MGEILSRLLPLFHSYNSAFIVNSRYLQTIVIWAPRFVPDGGNQWNRILLLYLLALQCDLIPLSLSFNVIIITINAINAIITQPVGNSITLVKQFEVLR